MSVGFSIPDCACGRGQRRAKCPDVFFMLLRCGNADFEGGNVGQKWTRGKRGLLPLSVLLGLHEGHELDLDDRAGKTKHTPGEDRTAGGRTEDENQRRKLMSAFSPLKCSTVKQYSIIYTDCSATFITCSTADRITDADRVVFKMLKYIFLKRRQGNCQAYKKGICTFFNAEIFTVAAQIKSAPCRKWKNKLECVSRM